MSVNNLLQQLITKICKYSENDEKFAAIEKKCHKELAMAPSFFANVTDIERSINGLCDKFIYHGLINQSNYLRQLADNYLKPTMSNEELQNRLNIMQFLICMSTKPTDRAIDFKPQSLKQDHVDDITDWTAYLLPEELKWVPPPDDSDSWSDTSSDDDTMIKPTANPIAFKLQQLGPSDDERCGAITSKANEAITVNYALNGTSNSNKETVIQQLKSQPSTSVAFDEIQSTNWINKPLIRCIPKETHPSQRTGLLFEEHVSKMMLGLNPPLNIIPEYVIAREIIWQFVFPHNGTTYTYNKGKFVPKDNFTMVGVRQPTIYRFLFNFVVYLEHFDELREFHKSISRFEYNVPETYRSYIYIQRKFLQSLYEELVDIERMIRNHKSFTLLNLWANIQDKMEIIKILGKIQKTCILDYNQHSNLVCSTNLLTKLHKCLLLSVDKLELDVCLTLYLGTLYKYISLIDLWLSKNIKTDIADEFVIADCNESLMDDSDSWYINIKIRELNFAIRNDKLMEIICKDVFATIRNTHLLNLMDVTTEEDFKRCLYDEFIERILKKISKHFGCDLCNEEEIEYVNENNVYGDNNLYGEHFMMNTDNPDGLVVSNDALLMFGDLFTNEQLPKEKSKATLYERISQITTGLFPCYHLAHETLLELLKERFDKYGEEVKNVLRDKYNFKKHIEILRYVCLYEDDVIYPFYNKLFKEIESGKMAWADSMELTSHLQNILHDKFGDLIKNCSIILKQNAEYCKDSLKAIALLTMTYNRDWPINIFITNEHIEKYREIFQFMLQVKWALHNLNGSSTGYYFSKICWNKKVGRSVMRLLNTINFELLRIFNKIQHYVLGYAFPIYTKEFDNDLIAARNFDDIIATHTRYVENVYNICVKLKGNDTYGFTMLLYMVRRLTELYVKPEQPDMWKMWRNGLRKCCKNLEDVMIIE